MTDLLDVNVWSALTDARHVHHEAALRAAHRLHSGDASGISRGFEREHSRGVVGWVPEGNKAAGVWREAAPPVSE